MKRLMIGNGSYVSCVVLDGARPLRKTRPLSTRFDMTVEHHGE